MVRGKIKRFRRKYPIGILPCEKMPDGILREGKFYTWDELQRDCAARMIEFDRRIEIDGSRQ